MYPGSLGFALGFLMYLTPVVYPVPKEGWASTLVHLNPATYLLGATRDWLSFGESVYATQFLISIRYKHHSNWPRADHSKNRNAPLGCPYGYVGVPPCPP